MCPYCKKHEIRATVPEETETRAFIKFTPCKNRKCTSNPHGSNTRWGYLLDEFMKGKNSWGIDIVKIKENENDLKKVRS